MKIWNGYGSEHSANLVMIGHFQDQSNADAAEYAMREIRDYLSRTDETYRGDDRFTNGMMDLLKRLNLWTFHPSEIEQFTYDVSVKQEGDRITITTDEMDISAFLKVLIECNGKVEIYSAHVFPNTDEEQ